MAQETEASKSTGRSRVILLLLLHIVFLLAMVGYMALITKTGMGCPIRRLTGIPCPGCGLTRATLSLLRLDFAGAFAQHPMVFVIFPYLFFLFHFQTRMFAKWPKGVKVGITLAGAGLFIGIYAVRLALDLIP